MNTLPLPRPLILTTPWIFDNLISPEEEEEDWRAPPISLAYGYSIQDPRAVVHGPELLSSLVGSEVMVRKPSETGKYSRGRRDDRLLGTRQGGPLPLLLSTVICSTMGRSSGGVILDPGRGDHKSSTCDHLA